MNDDRRWNANMSSNCFLRSFFFFFLQKNNVMMMCDLVVDDDSIPYSFLLGKVVCPNFLPPLAKTIYH